MSEFITVGCDSGKINHNFIKHLGSQGNLHKVKIKKKVINCSISKVYWKDHGLSLNEMIPLKLSKKKLPRITLL